MSGVRSDLQVSNEIWTVDCLRCCYNIVILWSFLLFLSIFSGGCVCWKVKSQKNRDEMWRSHPIERTNRNRKGRKRCLTQSNRFETLICQTLINHSFLCLCTAYAFSTLPKEQVLLTFQTNRQELYLLEHFLEFILRVGDVSKYIGIFDVRVIIT